MKTDDRTPHSRQTARFLAVGLGIPLLAAAASVITQIAYLHRLPDRIAVHWTVSGDPDRWASPWTLIVLTLVICVALPTAIVVPSVTPLRTGHSGGAFRTVATASAAFATGLAILLGGSVIQQADGAAADPTSALGLGFVVGAAVGAAAWFLLPADPAREQSTPAEAIDTRPGEKIVWLGTETVNRAVVAITLIAFATAIVAIVATWTSGATAGAVIAAVVILAAVGLAAATLLAFHIRIDETGLTVRSVAGLPRFHIPADQIESVSAVEIRAVGEFGGYGIRFARGRTGVILRSGDAIEVHRAGRRAFVVTVDDADTAATALATVADAARN